MLKTIISSSLVMMLLLQGLADAADVYIWTDQNGVTHIEDQAPPMAPDSKIKVEKHTFEKPADVPVVPSPETGTLTTTPAPGDTGAAAQAEQEQKEGERLRQEELEQARREYEEANAKKERYLYKYKNADNSKARYYWKEKLKDLEEKRQKLEALEKDE